MTNQELECRTCKPPKRHPGCHSTCENYIEWKKECLEEKAKLKKLSMTDKLIDLHKKDVIYKMKKKYQK